MTSIKSAETITAEIKEFLRVFNRSIATGENSLTKDLIITPLSRAGQSIMSQVEIARDLAILSKNTESDLDNIGTNYKKERLPGSFSTVTLTFYTTTLPSADIVIAANTVATTIGTSFASAVSFSTVSEARFTVANMASYYSNDRARYEFQVTGLCNTVGTAGNVGANFITKLSGSISGVDGVTNITAATGGTDEESDDDFRARIQLAMIGRDLNTVNGLKSYMRDVGFTDAYPVRVESADAERATGIDVFAITNSSATATDTFGYDASQIRYYLTNRPVLEITSVVGSNKGTLSASVDYDAVVDNTSPLRRSINAADYIRIKPAAALLAGEQLTVTYNYAPSIKQAQDNLDLNSNDILTADPLIKRAYPLFLSVVASLTLKANADGPATRNKVRSALSQFIATYRLGDDIQKSDLVVVMQEGYGDYPVEDVDAVVISSYILTGEGGTIYQPVNEVIAVNNKQYAVYGSASIT